MKNITNLHKILSGTSLVAALLLASVPVMAMEEAPEKTSVVKRLAAQGKNPEETEGYIQEGVKQLKVELQLQLTAQLT